MRVEDACIIDSWARSDAFYLVEEGAVLVRCRPMGSPCGCPEEIEVSVLGLGSYFGALAQLPSPPLVGGA